MSGTVHSGAVGHTDQRDRRAGAGFESKLWQDYYPIHRVVNFPPQHSERTILRSSLNSVAVPGENLGNMRGLYRKFKKGSDRQSFMRLAAGECLCFSFRVRLIFLDACQLQGPVRKRRSDDQAYFFDPSASTINIATHMKPWLS